MRAIRGGGTIDGSHQRGRTATAANYSAGGVASTVGSGAEREALILRAVAAYQDSFWKLILRGRRVRLRRDTLRAFPAVFCGFLFRFGIGYTLPPHALNILRAA